MCYAVVTIPTAHYDNSRVGVNTSETILTPANVNTISLLGKYNLDGPLYTQPLYVPGLTINGGLHNTLYAATMNNTIYAFDADTPGSAQLWSNNFGQTWTGYPDFGQFYHQAIGILGTPVIDVAGGFIYLVTVNNTPTFTLRKIDMLTGVQSASVNISASVSGTGTGSSGGALTFASLAGNQTQRTPLTLANGNVYFGFGSNAENTSFPNFHGWVFAYDTTTLTQTAVICLSPNGNAAGVWESGGGLAVDGSGNLYFATGNGDFDGTANFGQTIVKTSASLVIQDWFTPSNNAVTSAQDADMSAGRVMLIPSTTLVTIGSKDGRIWVIDTTNMGHLQGTGAAPQVFSVPDSFTPGAATGIYGGLFFGSAGYFPVHNFSIHEFAFSGSTYATTPLASSVDPYAQATMAGSSNVGSNPIVWGITVASSAFSSPQPATLHAWNPANFTEYWNSGSTIGNYAKFAAPVVANGRVYISTNDGKIAVFGMAPLVSNCTG